MFPIAGVLSALHEFAETDQGGLLDCNGNGVIDLCDIEHDDSTDENENGVPDECDTPPCSADLTGDGQVDAGDLAILLGAWGSNPGHSADTDGSGVVDAADLALLLGAWGPCL